MLRRRARPGASGARTADRSTPGRDGAGGVARDAAADAAAAGAGRGAEQRRSATATGPLRRDLLALARNQTDRINTEAGRTSLRALVMDRRGPHDEETRMMLSRARFAVVRTVLDRARKRGELRDGVNT